jgi:N,N'-diacetyllegionaminate synthase
MKFNKKINIDTTLISENSRAFVIAEAGVNHGGNMEIAKQLIDLAVDAKADAVKFQTFKAEHLILSDIQKAPYQKNTTDESESQYDMLKRLEVNREQNLELNQYCLDKGIIFLTTPFDEESLEEIDELHLPAYKVASTDTTNLPFLKKIAKKGKPIFLSTGMSYLSEVRLALETIYEYNKDVVLLQCTANYPIQDNEANLAVINTYRDNFDILIGYSDHSVGLGVAPFAIPMGAKVVEKHFTLNKSDEGPDHAASLSPSELIEFVKTIRSVEIYMGSEIKEPSLSEQKTRKSLQKCLVASQDINEGELFNNDNLTAKRTGGVGISPIKVHKLLGVKSTKSYKKNQIIENL